MTAGAMGEGRGEGIQCVRCDTGTIDRVQNGAEGAAARGPSANGIQFLVRGRLPLKVVFHQKTSSVKGRLLSKVVLCQRSSSIEGCLPLLGHFHFCPVPCAFQQCASRLLSKVVSRQRLSSIKSRLPSKVVFHQRSSSIKGRLPSKDVFH